jgi:hypothetical protein
VDDVTVEQLQIVLAENGDRLAELPGVVGWGVGIGVAGRPVIQVFVCDPVPADVIAELERLFDDVEIIRQSRPAEAN